MSPAAQWLSSRSRDHAHPQADGGGGVHWHIEVERTRRDKLRTIIALSLDEDLDELGAVPASTSVAAKPTTRWS